MLSQNFNIGIMKRHSATCRSVWQSNPVDVMADEAASQRVIHREIKRPLPHEDTRVRGPVSLIGIRRLHTREPGGRGELRNNQKRRRYSCYCAEPAPPLN